MELRVGNKYRLGRKIGSGSFGDIYLGEYHCSLSLLCKSHISNKCCSSLAEFHWINLNLYE